MTTLWQNRIFKTYTFWTKTNFTMRMWTGHSLLLLYATKKWTLKQSNGEYVLSWSSTPLAQFPTMSSTNNLTNSLACIRKIKNQHRASYKFKGLTTNQLKNKWVRMEYTWVTMSLRYYHTCKYSTIYHKKRLTCIYIRQLDKHHRLLKFIRFCLPSSKRTHRLSSIILTLLIMFYLVLWFPWSTKWEKLYCRK